MTFRDRVLARELLYGLFLDLDSPASAELAGHAGYDWLLIDLEHGAATEATLQAHLYAVETSPAIGL
ncbi:MAG: aldolase/citrate lyase family protein, partial [Chloroflexi bacterium]|nr:aldolase/citrate lyase family protein [Chloroflexota bacterium]